MILSMTSGEKTYINAYTGDESIPMFITFAIEQYKHYKGISGEKAVAMLEDAGVLKHLEEYFDVLHTQSAQWLVTEIDELVNTHNSIK